MDYYISYKGKLLGKAMTNTEAQNRIYELSQSFDGLEVVAVSTDHCCPTCDLSSVQAEQQ